MMDKATFRKKYKEQRSTLTDESVDALSLAIANQALSLPIWEHAYYHLYLTISEKKEIDTSFLLHILQGRDKSVVVSKTNFASLSMEHYLLQENTPLAVSSYGIPEPTDGIEIPEEKLDVVFVPLLAFDLSGNRIGYGKGFYDRFLSKCKKEAIFIGLSFFNAEDRIPLNNNDIQLHYCITPNKVYAF